jgi:peptide chain release factor 1
MVESKCANVFAGAGSVRSSAGHVHGLHGGDGALLRRGDALLEEAHLVGEGRLVTDGRRRAAEERGHLGAGLREAEDVVDEEEHVLVLLVAEIFRHRERGERDAHTGARGLVHLAEHERHLRLREVLLVDDAGLGHFVVEVVALARTLADAREHGHAAVRLRDVVDELEDHDGLADAGAAERAGLAALDERADQVDDLDAGLEDFRLGVLLGERRSGAVNRVASSRASTAPLPSTGVAGDVEDAAEHAVADGHRDGCAGVEHRHAAHEALGGGHRDGAGHAARRGAAGFRG